MKWMKNLYTGSLSEKKVRDLKKRIRKRKRNTGCYVLFPSANPSNQLDLMDAGGLLHDCYRHREDLVIVGIASGKEEALQLLVRLTQECVEATGTGNLRGYLAARLEEEGTEEQA